MLYCESVSDWAEILGANTGHRLLLATKISAPSKTLLWDSIFGSVNSGCRMYSLCSTMHMHEWTQWARDYVIAWCDCTFSNSLSCITEQRQEPIMCFRDVCPPGTPEDSVVFGLTGESECISSLVSQLLVQLLPMETYTSQKMWGRTKCLPLSEVGRVR